MLGGAVIASALAAAALSLTPGTNGSFDAVKELPTEWKLVEYVADASTATIRRGAAADGKQFLRLEASKPNHTRIFMPVDVEPESTYKFSAQIRVPKGEEVPAVLMVEGANTTTLSVDGDNAWHKSELYIRTGSAEQITPVLSLGRFGELAGGVADFDEVALEKVDSAPESAIVADATATEPAAGAADGAGTTPATAADENGPSKWLVPLALLLIALVSASAWVLKRGDANDPALRGETKPDGADPAPDGADAG